MAKLDSLGKIIETDVLVIGGGPSGLWAANRAKELGSDVFIVDKGPQEWGGLTGLSGIGAIQVHAAPDYLFLQGSLMIYFPHYGQVSVPSDWAARRLSEGRP